jgi:type I restriction enzyme S subunit
MNHKLKIDKSTWILTKLGELAEDISDRVDNPSQSKYDRFVGLEHFVSGELKIKSWGTTESLASSAKAFKTGDILFARRNAYLRRSSMVDFDGCCSGDAFVLRENHSKIVPGFLAFIVNSNGLWDYANSNAAGTMSQRVKWRDLAEYEFLLPPKKEQAKLAELLWAMDEVVEKEISLKNYISKYYEAISGRIFSKKVKEFDLSLPFDVNSQIWKEYTLNDLCELITDGAHASPKTDPNGLPIGTVENMLDDSINIPGCRLISKEDFESLVRNNCQPVIGDVLFSKDGTIGKTFVFNQKEKIILLSSIAIIRTKTKMLDPYFCSLLLKSPVFFTQIEKMKSGTALKRIVLKDIKRFEVLLPSIEFQRDICNFIQILLNNIKVTESKIASSQALQKSLINQIF